MSGDKSLLIDYPYQSSKYGYLVMRLSPSSTLSTVAAVFLSLLLITIWLSTKERITGLQWSASENALYAIGDLLGDEETISIAVSSISTGDKEIFLTAFDLQPEPDVMSRFTETREFWDRQGQISELLLSPEIVITSIDNEQYARTIRYKGILDIPLSFWLLSLAGFLGLMITTGVWGYRPNLISARIFFICGIGFSLLSLMLAYYSTRELAIVDSYFRIAHAINRMGMIMLTFGGAALLWHYPSQFGSFPMGRFITAIALLFWINETFWFFDTPFHSYFDIFFLCTAISFVNGYRQWRRSEGQPLERVALRWLLLSFFICFTAIWLLYITPILLTNELKLNLVIANWIVLCVFLGIAVGISRYRLFDLERWWLGIWLWFISGMLVFIIDIALITLLDLGFVSSLTLTILIVGWLYFPIRQQVLRKYLRNQVSPLSVLLPKILSFMLMPHTKKKSSEFWYDLIDQAIKPIQIEVSSICDRLFVIEDDGMVLRVPSLMEGVSYEIAGRDRGKRLFSKDDIAILKQCFELIQYGEQQYQLREQSADRERERIMRDLHDDVGAKLLTLIHRVPDAYSDMARSALTTLRETIFSMASNNDIPLNDFLGTLREECMDRCNAAMVKVFWPESQYENICISAHIQINTTRVIRECITNSLSHSRPEHIFFNYTVSKGKDMEILIEHDGNSTPVKEWKSHNGTINLVRRMNELSGTISFSDRTPIGVKIHIVFPIFN